MATTAWRGTQSATWSLAANWTNGVPTNGDVVIFDQKLADGAYSPYGEDQSAVTLDRLIVSDVYTGTIGSSDKYLQINTGDYISNGKQAGAAYIHGTLTNIWGRDGTTYIKGDATKVKLDKGAYYFESIDIGGTLVISSFQSQNTLIVTFASDVELPNTVELIGGQVNNYADINTLVCQGGTWRNYSGDLRFVLLSGGTLRWTDGDIGEIRISNAGFDGSISVQERTVREITMLSGSRLNFDDVSGSITVTNPIHYFGGNLSIAPNKKLTFPTYAFG